MTTRESSTESWLQAIRVADESVWPELGAPIWLDQGVRLKEAFVRLALSAFADIGYERIELPFQIPRSVYERQPDHFAGLRPLTYTLVADDGAACCVLRTTSETPFTDFFSRAFSREDYPLRYVQAVAVFRNENETRLRGFLRTRELNPFVETYAIFGDNRGAENDISELIGTYRNIMDALALPFVVSVRPPFDTFPEARYTVAFDTPLPDGSVLQTATVHHLGDSFARAFGLIHSDGTVPIQTSSGISGRALACSLQVHRQGDRAVLPPALSEIRLAHVPPTTDMDTKRLSQLAGIASSAAVEVKTTSSPTVPPGWWATGGIASLLLTDAGRLFYTDDPATSPRAIHDAALWDHLAQLVEARARLCRQRARDIEESFVLGERSLRQVIGAGDPGIIEMVHCGSDECFDDLRTQLDEMGQVLGKALGLSASGAEKGVCKVCGVSTASRANIALHGAAARQGERSSL